jgi:response regulator of citrate/malate metabolism
MVWIQTASPFHLHKLALYSCFLSSQLQEPLLLSFSIQYISRELHETKPTCDKYVPLLSQDLTLKKRIQFSTIGRHSMAMNHYRDPCR